MQKARENQKVLGHSEIDKKIFSQLGIKLPIEMRNDNVSIVSAVEAEQNGRFHLELAGIEHQGNNPILWAVVVGDTSENPFILDVFESKEHAVKLATDIKNIRDLRTMEKEAPATIKYIGERLPKPDWETARDLVSSAGRKGFVYLAKPNAQYAGKVLMMSDTHLVQQVGKNSAVAHDLSILENGPELERQFDNGEIKAGRTNIKVEYGQDRGKADILTYNQQRAETVQTQAEKWAEQNITNSRSRETFLKHVRTFAQDMAKGQEPAKTLPDKAKAPEKTQAPQQQQRGR